MSAGAGIAGGPFSGRRRALVLGIGGGGDVVGSLAIAREIEASGGAAELGGVAWERHSIDPYHPGPRPLEHLNGIERIGVTDAALCGPDGATPEGARLAEAGVAAHIGRPTALIDVHGGPRRIGEAIAAAAGRLDCDLVVLLDVGGDVLADGSEPGLASPLCDAVMLAAARHLPEELGVLGVAFGSGCDGELTHAEVLARVAHLGRAGAWLTTLSPPAHVAEEVIALAADVPTEASLMAARCALGEIGPAEIRDGRRSVELGPVGALAFVFDPLRAIGGPTPLADAVADAGSLEEAHDILTERGLVTELAWERRRAAEAEG